MTQRLDQELLMRFEDALFRAVPEYREHLSPGLDVRALDDFEARLPGALPLEAREWWGWRNGVRKTPAGKMPDGVPSTFGFGEFQLSSMAECLDAYEDLRARTQEMTSDEAESFAPQMRFSIDSSATVSFDLVGDGASSDVSPLFDSDGFSNHYGEQIAASFGEFVLWWTEALESGALKWTWPEGWTDIPKELPRGLALWGLGTGGLD